MMYYQVNSRIKRENINHELIFPILHWLVKNGGYAPEWSLAIQLLLKEIDLCVGSQTPALTTLWRKSKELRKHTLTTHV